MLYFKKSDGDILGIDEDHPGNRELIFQYIQDGLEEISWPPLPTEEELKASFKRFAKLALEATSNTMDRITEATILKSTSFSQLDVIKFMEYRKALRDIISGHDTTSASLPTPPLYPEGT
jgi:alpha-amylase/alpha-mannosidase (GH57 family)